METCLGIALVIGLLIAVGVIREWLERGRRSPSEAGATAGLELQIHRTDKAFGEHTLNVFELRIRGPVSVPADNFMVRQKVGLHDVTDGRSEAKPVLCLIPDLQESDSIFFSWSSDPHPIPYQHAVISDWMPVLAVPVEALVFPKKGRRRLAFKFDIVSAQGNLPMGGAECTIAHDNPEIGYLEAQENRRRAEVLAVALAVAICAVDGRIGESEAETVRTWIRKRIDAVPQEERSEVKHRLNAAARETQGRLRKGPPVDVPGICRELVQIASLGERYEILQLSLSIVGADGKATEQELAAIHDLAQWLEVDRDRIRAMVDKALPVSMHDVENIDRLLGIERHWTTEEVKAHLLKEYKKWNARVTHQDPKVREQATRMLELIAQTRAAAERIDAFPPDPAGPP